jgi:hypothetical protein
MLGEERVLPGLDAIGKSGGGGHRSILSGGAKLHVRVVLQGLPYGPLNLA